MAKAKKQVSFEEYILHTDANKKDKTLAWSTAIGLQQVDGLTPSAYLYETAKRNIEGELSFDEARNLIESYYQNKTVRNDDEDERTEEADKVSSRIAQILSEPSFNFSPSHLIAIHKRLFEGIFKFAGKIRDYDITKKEWVLNGDSVMYGAAFELKMALDYDFEQERAFNYEGLSVDETVKHITYFVSRLWQIHAFGEGNTRATAVFTIKYLRSLGFKADNDIFAHNSWYFRNALVRANYNNLQKGPAMRNTAPCIAYACWKIRKRYPSANIVVTPADARVEDHEEFRRVISKALEFTAKGRRIVTVGVTPTRPETGYGYIQSVEPDHDDKELRMVMAFKEKPDYQTAVNYVASGDYLWNAGIFVWNADTIVESIRKFTPSFAEKMDVMSESFYTDDEKFRVDEIFPTCEKISIDYAVMEKA